MSHHTNPVIKKHIDSSQQLVEKMNQLTTQLSTNLLKDFQHGMGAPFPSAVEANARVFQYDMVYSTDPSVDEYLSGAKNVLDAAVGEDYPAMVLNALNIVQNVAQKIIGSGTIQTGLQSDSARLHPKKKNEQTYIVACYSLISECSASDWATNESFYVAYYAFALWVPSAEELRDITTARNV